MQHAVIILPTYNERGNIVPLIESIEKITQTIAGFDFSILVVDDSSPDGTANAIKKLQKKYKNLLLLTGEKEGLGVAYVRGMEYAIDKKNADIVVEMDADGQHPPELLVAMFKQIKKGADFVIGSRYISGGSIPRNWGIHRKVYSNIGNLVVRFGLMKLGVHDWTSGYRAIRTKVFKRVSRGLNKYPGYTFQIAFLNRAHNAKFLIAEVPLKFIDRKHGHSKLIPFDYIKNVFLYVLHNSTFIKYVIIGVIGFSIQTIVAKGLIFVNFFPGLAVTVGAFLAIITNFLGNNVWTFSHKRHRGIKTLLKKFSHFLTASIGAVIIQGVVVEIGSRIFGERVFGQETWFVLMIFAIGFLVIPYNYFIYHRFIWRAHEE